MNPVYHQAKFINSSPDLKDTPEDQGREVAFAGRSNAGKSSAINTLTRQNGLARTSKTPGRTQMLNFFEINEQQRFVDLPGYGYAKVPVVVKKKWHELMEKYLTRADKLTYGAAKNTLLQVQKELNDSNFPLTIQLFSALKKTGVDEVHQALDLLFNQVEQTESASE